MATLVNFLRRNIYSSYPVDYRSLFQEAKREFFNKKRGEWNLSACIRYIDQNRIDPLIFEEKLNEIFSKENLHSDRHRRGTERLLRKLGKSKRFQSRVLSKKNGICLKENADIVEFLSLMKYIKNKFLVNDFSHNQWVEIINMNYNTNKTSSTLQSYYKTKTIDIKITTEN